MSCGSTGKSVLEDRIWPLLSAPWMAATFICFQELIATAFSQQVEMRFDSHGFFRGWGEGREEKRKKGKKVYTS